MHAIKKGLKRKDGQYMYFYVGQTLHEHRTDPDTGVFKDVTRNSITMSLGSFKLAHLDDEAERERFWCGIEEKLQCVMRVMGTRLGDDSVTFRQLTEQERAIVRRRILKIVPRGPVNDAPMYYI